MVTCSAIYKHYIGILMYVARRLNSHKSKLRRNCHDCAQLQADYNLYGENNFLFQKLEIGLGLDKERLERLETDILDPQKLYNAYTNWRKKCLFLIKNIQKKHAQL